MKEIKETCYKGTRIIVGNEKRQLISDATSLLILKGYHEIQIPIIQFEETFQGKVGEENKNMMFCLTDGKDRKLCLAPEYTAVVQKLSKTTYKYDKDVMLFYVQECFRGEKPQAGRYRQFTQLGVEILNPTKDFMEELITLSIDIIRKFGVEDVDVNRSVVRGLDYYKNGQGFEIVKSSLGNAKQICGGGEYDGGIGFAIGVDRLISQKQLEE